MSEAPLSEAADLLITGAGALAEAVVAALALQPGPIRSIAIAARPSDRLTWLARSATARAASAGGANGANGPSSAVRVQAYPLEWEAPGALEARLARARPRVVLHTASLQSPWTLGGEDAWSALVRRAGYGLTLPLQLALAAQVGRAVAHAAPGASYVNACYPDAVNPLLAALGIPVTCGIGNVAILAAMLHAEHTPGRWQLVAHHAHVSAAISGRPAVAAPLAWCEDHEVALTGWLAAAALPGDARLNLVTGAAAAPLLRALVDGGEHRGHAPGPGGLPGGYPIRLRDRALALDLPAAVTEEAARSANQAAAADDGVVIEAGGRIRWTASVLAALEALPAAAHAEAAALAGPWTAADAAPLAALALKVRASLQAS